MEVIERMSRARAGLYPDEPAPDPQPWGCLSIPRAWELALNPALWTDPERGHLCRCRRCSRLATVALRELPHPSVWTLLRVRLGLAREDERRLAQLHRDGGCPVCREREARMPSLQGLCGFLPPFAVPLPEGAGFAPAALDVRVRFADGRLRAVLFESGKKIVLDVRAADPAFRDRLVGFEIRDSEGIPVHEGFLVLLEKAADLFLGSLALDAAGLYRCLREDRIAGLAIAPLELALLDSEQRDRVAAAAAESDAPEDWRAWALRERARPERTEAERELLDRVLAAAAA